MSENGNTEFHWDYPIYLIRHGGGYASIVDPNAAPPDPGAVGEQEEQEAGESSGANVPDQMLVVFTQEDSARRFMIQFNMMGEPSTLGNGREFRTLVGCLQDPVNWVIFNPEPDGVELNADWKVHRSELIGSIKVDFSPWNYPIFAVNHESGFASIEGGDASNPMVALAVFTSEEKAESYANQLYSKAKTVCLFDLDFTRSFLDNLNETINAVALDPIIEDGRHSAKYCFSLDRLMDKYLVEEEK